MKANGKKKQTLKSHKRLIRILTREVEKDLDTLFVKLYGMAGTASGDITPGQQEELDGLKGKLVRLMVAQVRQNLT